MKHRRRYSDVARATILGAALTAAASIGVGVDAASGGSGASVQPVSCPAEVQQIVTSVQNDPSLVAMWETVRDPQLTEDCGVTAGEIAKDVTEGSSSPNADHSTGATQERKGP